MTIHINADLHPVVKERVGMLHWVMDPEVSGFIIGYDLGGNQVLICNFDVSLLYCLFNSRNSHKITPCRLKSTQSTHGTKRFVAKLLTQLLVQRSHTTY